MLSPPVDYSSTLVFESIEVATGPPGADSASAPGVTREQRQCMMYTSTAPIANVLIHNLKTDFMPLVAGHIIGRVCLPSPATALADHPGPNRVRLHNPFASLLRPELPCFGVCASKSILRLGNGTYPLPAPLLIEVTERGGWLIL